MIITDTLNGSVKVAPYSLEYGSCENVCSRDRDMANFDFISVEWLGEPWCHSLAVIFLIYSLLKVSFYFILLIILLLNKENIECILYFEDIRYIIFSFNIFLV